MASADYGVSKANFKGLILEKVEGVIADFGQKFVRDLGYNLDRSQDATGKLRQSIHFQVKVFTEFYEFKMLLEDYYYWIDQGRKPGDQPPIKDILKWISTKGISYSDAKTKRSNVTRKGLMVIAEDYRMQRSLAYVIARSINKKKTKGNHFYSEIRNDGRLDTLKKSLVQALKRDVIVTIKTL